MAEQTVKRSNPLLLLLFLTKLISARFEAGVRNVAKRKLMDFREFSGDDVSSWMRKGHGRWEGCRLLPRCHG